MYRKENGLDAKKYLMQIQKYDTLMKHRKVEIEQLRLRAEQPGKAFYGLEKVQRSKRIDRMEEDILNYADLENQLKEDVLKYWKMRSEIIRTLEQLKLVEYDLLYKVYVCGWTLQQVADEYDKSYSWATTTSGRALKNLQKIIDEKAGD